MAVVGDDERLIEARRTAVAEALHELETWAATRVRQDGAIPPDCFRGERAHPILHFEHKPATGGSFEAIAVQTGERELAGLGRAAVLTGDDVIDRERQPASRMRDAAVFAAVPSPV